MSSREVIAIDLGNESGRLFICRYDTTDQGAQLSGAEKVRFPNIPVMLNGTLHWDMLRLWDDIRNGLAQTITTESAGIGVCSFGVDYGLLDGHGALISNPVHMRDSRTEGTIAAVEQIIPALELYQRTGIAPHVINTLYQLVAVQRDSAWQLDAAHTLLTVPNLINYWLTGELFAEYTHSSTTQLLGAHSRDWELELITRLGLPSVIFPPVIQPGAQIGSYASRYGAIPVWAVAGHDTGSAVVAVPAETSHFAYISSGTWSLVGIETDSPILTPEALQGGITNEGGAFGTYRPLNLVMGLWLLQGCRTALNAGHALNLKGHHYNYPELLATMDAVPALQTVIDPDHESFFAPADMITAIQAFCQRTGQNPPDSIGALIRCVMESLALKYSVVIDRLARLSGKQIEVVHIVGGGSQNGALCQMTADATGLPVLAGPTEAAALGNGLVQLIALGDIPDLAAARDLVRVSYPPVRYDPDPANRAGWQAAAVRFMDMIAG